MDNHFKKELDKSRFLIVRHGLFFILLTIGLTLLSLILIGIEGQSILEMAIQYYIR